MTTIEKASILTLADIMKETQIVDATISKTTLKFSDAFEPSFDGSPIFPTVEYHLYFSSEDGKINYEHYWEFGLENHPSQKEGLEADRLQVYYLCKLLDTYDTTELVGKNVKLVFADKECNQLFGISNEVGNMFIIPDNIFINNNLKDTDHLYSLAEVYAMIDRAKAENFLI